MNVKSAMVRDVVSCHADTPLDSVAMTMWQRDCGCVPVVDSEDRPIGIVTDRDIAMGSVLQRKPLWEMTAQSICGSRELYCCTLTDDLHKALELMHDHAVRRLPVVNGKGKLVGIISMGDIIACSNVNRRGGMPFADTAGMLSVVSAHHA